MALTTVRNDGLASDAGGRVVLISSDTDGGSNLATVKITIPDSSIYSHYQLVWNGLYAGGAGDQFIHVYESGSKVSGSGDYTYNYFSQNAASQNGGGSTSATYMRLNYFAAGDAETERNDIIMTMHGAPSGERFKINGYLNGIASNGNVNQNLFHGYRLSTNRTEAIELSMQVGNIYYDSYYLYGIKE